MQYNLYILYIGIHFINSTLLGGAQKKQNALMRFYGEAKLFFWAQIVTDTKRERISRSECLPARFFPLYFSIANFTELCMKKNI